MVDMSTTRPRLACVCVEFGLANATEGVRELIVEPAVLLALVLQAQRLRQSPPLRQAHSPAYSRT